MLQLLKPFILVFGLLLPAIAAAEIGTQADYTKGARHHQNADFNKALGYFQRCASQNDPQCQFALGSMLFFGEGTAVDYQTSRALFQRCHQQKYGPCASMLGNMYQQGTGVTVNDKYALGYWRLAAYACEVNAQLSIAHSYFKGDASSQDYARALAWVYVADDLTSNAETQYAQQLLESHLDSAKQAYASALATRIQQSLKCDDSYSLALTE